MSESPAKIEQLQKRGATILCPSSVYVDPDVDLSLIAPDVVVHPGCRLLGKRTAIGPGVVLGEEAPVTLQDCRVADRCALKGGFFSGAVMLSGVSFGSGAHVRPGTLLEEQVSCGHNVGLKQTVLLPFVVTGSLVNFCDGLMAGGTDRRRHSEVGSSYVHFNYTPHQDKATPSLLGDVPRGVMLDQLPIFLGGQGGLVGPARIEYGTVIAAGTICRRDILDGGRLARGGAPAWSERPFEAGHYGSVARLLENNFIYIGNLLALGQWYRHVRSRFMMGDAWSRACHEGALDVLRAGVEERVKRLDELAERLRRSVELGRHKYPAGLPADPYDRQKAFAEQWPAVAPRLAFDQASPGDDAERDALLVALEALPAGTPYLEAVRSLDGTARAAGTRWLQSIVDAAARMRP